MTTVSQLSSATEQHDASAPSPVELSAGAITTSTVKSQFRHSLPPSPGEPFPQLLSDTGIFSDLKKMEVADGLLAYDINAPFWSDGAAKRRWISIAESSGAPITFSPTGEWKFPAGTVFVKHFEMPTKDLWAKPLRLETRILLCSAGGGVHGATYRWRADESDADLVETGTVETITVSPGNDDPAKQEWFYPGRQDCQVCHTPASGGVLGVNARQLNRLGSYGEPAVENQLVAWSRMGLLNPKVSPTDVSAVAALAPVNDKQASVEHRVRTYLDVNCAMCHRPGNDSGYFDARFDTPLTRQHLIDGTVKIDMGLDKAKVVAPRDPWRSTLLSRIATTDRGVTMPPIGHHRIDTAAVDLVKRWVIGMPGEDVLAPPRLNPAGGGHATWPVVTMSHDDRDAIIRYTTNGAPPNEYATAYDAPIQTSGPVTIRARAFKQGAKKSIPVTETYTQP